MQYNYIDNTFEKIILKCLTQKIAPIRQLKNTKSPLALIDAQCYGQKERKCST